MFNFSGDEGLATNPTAHRVQLQGWCDRRHLALNAYYVFFNECRNGYYAAIARLNALYGGGATGREGCQACTNIPDNAHATGPGEDWSTFNDTRPNPPGREGICPWRCNPGFGMNPARNGCISCPGERRRSGASNGVCVTCAVGQIFDDSVGVERCVQARPVSQAMMMSGPRGAGIPIEEQCFSVLSDKGYECCINGNTWNNNVGECCVRGRAGYADCIAKTAPTN